MFELKDFLHEIIATVVKKKKRLCTLNSQNKLMNLIHSLAKRSFR